MRDGTAGKKGGYDILEDKQQDVQSEDHRDDLEECVQNHGRLTRYGHAQEYAENVQREQRNDRSAYQHVDNFAELFEESPDHTVAEPGGSETNHKRCDQSGHHAHQGRNVECEIRSKRTTGLDSLSIGSRLQHVREEQLSGAVSHHAGAESGTVGKQCRGDKQLAGTAADVGDCRSHEAQDDQGYAESQKLAEYLVESGEDACRPFGKDISAADTCRDRHDNPGQKTEFDFMSLHAQN